MTVRNCKDAPQWASYEARARRAQRDATQAEVAEFVAVLSASYKDCKTKLATVDRLLVKVESRARAAR